MINSEGSFASSILLYIEGQSHNRKVILPAVWSGTPPSRILMCYDTFRCEDASNSTFWVSINRKLRDEHANSTLEVNFPSLIASV